jgi:hypothetical protein
MLAPASTTVANGFMICSQNSPSYYRHERNIEP